MRIHELKYAAIVSFREYTNSPDDSGNSLIQMSTGSMWIHQMTMIIHWYKYAALCLQEVNPSNDNDNSLIQIHCLVSSGSKWIHQMIMVIH